ncbi:MAG: tetratricopeptide repeat protein [Desulfobulbus sp.]|nr:tetratricopeptide repeat protein [Desulfobulbus sp.]
MGAVTYPNTGVSNYVTSNFIPVQLRFDAKPEAADFNITWTPTTVVLDETGKEHHRAVGFLPPEEFIPFLMLSQAKTAFDLTNFESAITLLEKVIKEYAQSAAAPEASFHLGVSRYKATSNPAPLKEAYQFLKDNYPNSEWLKRAQPYSLL